MKCTYAGRHEVEPNSDNEVGVWSDDGQSILLRYGSLIIKSIAPRLVHMMLSEDLVCIDTASLHRFIFDTTNRALLPVTDYRKMKL